MRQILPLALCSLLFLNVTPLCGADDSETPAEEIEIIPFKVVEKKGIVFRVPDDIPFVEKDGILKPITYEEYFYSKIKKLETTVADLNSRLEQMESPVAEVEEQAPESVPEENENTSVLLP